MVTPDNKTRQPLDRNRTYLLRKRETGKWIVCGKCSCSFSKEVWNGCSTEDVNAKLWGNTYICKTSL